MKFEETEITKVFKDEMKKEQKVGEDGIKRHPMRLKVGYVPTDPTWPKDPMTGYPQKVLAGQEVMIPIEEARRLIKLGVAERADELEL